MIQKTYALRVSEKGQIVIPAELRERYDIQKGDPLQIWVLNDGSIHLVPETMKYRREIAKHLLGCMEGTGVLKHHMAEKQRDKEREEKKFDSFHSPSRAR